MKDSGELSALRALQEISEKLPGAEEYVMVHHPAFRVGKKPFAIAGMDVTGHRATVSINLGPEAQGSLLGDERFTKTPYIGQHGWVTVDLDALSEPELKALVTDSYLRIAGKKLLAQFDSTQPTNTRAAKKSVTKQSKPARAAADSGRSKLSAAAKAKAKLRYARRP